MFDLRKIPMLRVVLPFFAGVLAGLGAGPELIILPVLILLMTIWLLLVLVFRWQRRRPGVHPGPVLLALILLFFLAGAGTGMECRPHDPGLPEDQRVMVRGQICASPRPVRNSNTFDLQARYLITCDTLYPIQTLLKCYLPLSSDSLVPAAGETWNLCGKLAGIQGRKNPFMPDYREIMGRKKCWYRFYISTGPPEEGFNRRIPMEKAVFNPARIRAELASNWQGDPQEIALLKAVCLGDRSSLSEDMRQAYTAAGGMHLLAVSGLHVGLIWWVLQYLTGWMNLIFRKELQRSILVVGLLWFYACITGFSSSVCRAVTMFSFFSMGRMRGGQIHILNVILASAFLLVLIHPPRLLDVGFQLSYAAITGIVTIHPLVRSVLNLKSRVLRRIWEAGSLSLAAQLATAPLVIFYFHQLPLYAILTSLVTIPMLSVLIAVFVCSVPLVASGILENGFSYLLVMLARLMNRSMEHLSSLPGAVLGDLQLAPLELLVWLLVLLLGLMAMHGRSRLPCYLVLLLLSIFLVRNACTSLERRSSSAMVIGHFRGASMLSLRVGEHADHYCWYRDTGSVVFLEAYRELAWNRRIYKNRVMQVDSLDQLNGRISSCQKLREGMWLVGTDGIYGLVFTSGCLDRLPGSARQPDFILLSGEPPVDCIRPLLGLEELLIVMDGSNRKWYKERVLAHGKKIYLTDQAGALVKRW